MIRPLSVAAAALVCLTLPAQAEADQDEIVRLPGQGEVRDDALRERAKADRLKPGAGLLITFDADRNGRISQGEVDAGIPLAFRIADANEDGFLTAFEQQDWAEGLPTRDDSLANPFRFDPNLDRRVDLQEFTTVIVNLSLDYADEASGEIIVSDLRAPRVDRRTRDQRIEGSAQRDPVRPQPNSRNSSIRD